MKKILVCVWEVILAIFKTFTVSLYKNIKRGVIFAMRPEERNKLKRDLKYEKMAGLLDERVRRAERLLYSMFEDMEYQKSNKGKNDLKELKKEVKK